MWDGDQVLAETRYPNEVPDQDAGLDPENAGAAAVTGTLTAGGHPYGGPNTSEWAQSGRVVYVHGAGIDQPLGLIRMDYSHNFAGPILIVPHANWRGVYETASFGAGESAHCDDFWMPANEVAQFDSMGHRTNPYENDTTDVQQHRCVQIDFPGKYMGMTHLSRRQTVAGPISWMGSLVQDAQDASGLMYRRNRQYDPTTGRFTREDPIGLAGGLNAYGFAGGDPISNSDPLGLYIACTGHACATWWRLFREVRSASHSSDQAIRGAGEQLLTIMSALVLRTDRRYSLHETSNSAWSRFREWGG